MLQPFPLGFYGCHFFIAKDSAQKETEGKHCYSNLSNYKVKFICWQRLFVQ